MFLSVISWHANVIIASGTSIFAASVDTSMFTSQVSWVCLHCFLFDRRILAALRSVSVFVSLSLSCSYFSLLKASPPSLTCTTFCIGIRHGVNKYMGMFCLQTYHEQRPCMLVWNQMTVMPNASCYASRGIIWRRINLAFEHFCYYNLLRYSEVGNA